MSSTTERTVNGVRIVIHRDVCDGFAQCMDTAEEAFDLDDDGVVTFTSPEDVDRERLLEACRACPVAALQVFDSDNKQLVP